MRIWAYCCQEFEKSTRRAAGVKPLTCPPMCAEDFDPRWLGELESDKPWDLIYLDLHGRPGDTAWYGDDGIVAMTEEQVRSVDLGGAVVFAVNCYLADDESPMMDALLDAGAQYVIGGDGLNYGGTRSMVGASKLGQRFRQFYELLGDPLRALSLAKQAVQVSKAISGAVGRARIEEADADTLEFRAFYRKPKNDKAAMSA
jgi:hypothetical protein